MAFRNWHKAELTGDGVIKDVVGQGVAGHEVVISSIWVANNSLDQATVEVFFTTAGNTDYFKAVRTIPSGEDTIFNAGENGAAFLACLNNNDQIRARSDKSGVSVLVSLDETYTAGLE